jgi:hypothetical protein
MGNIIGRVTSRSRKMTLAGTALLVTTALTSCIRVNMDIELDDGMASGEMVLAVSQELLDMAGGEPADLFAETDVPAGATVEPYEDDGYVGQRYIFDDAELSEFSDQQFSITYDEESGRYEVNGTMDFGAEDLTELPGDMAELAAETFDVSISVTFPGEVIDNNGDLDGQTVTWRPGFDNVTEMHAVAEEGSSGVPVWGWVTLGILAAALLGGLVFIAGRRRNETADPATGEPSTHMADQPTRDLTDAATHHESPAEAAVQGEVASHGESPASEAVHDDVAPHEESPPGEAVHDDVAPHEQSPLDDAVHDDVAPYERSPASFATGEVTGDPAQGDVPTPEPPDGDKR